MPLRYVTFEQIVELSNEGIWVLDEQACVVYVNRRAAEIAGVSVDELMGQPVGRFVVPDRRGRLEQGLAALARGESVRVEAPVQLADGRRIWCQLSGSPVRSPDGRFSGTIGIVSDVTERCEALAAVQRAEERFRLISTHTADVIWAVDLATGRPTYVSPSVERVAGFTVEEVMRGRLEDWVAPESLAAAKSAMAECMGLHAQAKPFVIEVDNLRKDGAVVPTEVVASVIFDADGRPREVVGISRDISARRQAEAALRESERLLRESQRVARIGSFALDIPGNRWTGTEALGELFGIGADYPRTVAGWLALIHPDDREAVHAEAREFVKHPGPVTRQYRVVRPADGRTRWVQACGEYTRDVSGAPVLLYGTIQDITETKEAEEKRHQLETRALQGQKLQSLGVLAGGVAHEFNNLLTSILGYAELTLQDLPADSPLRENIRAIEAASQRAAEISRQMLAYSGRARFVVEPADVSRVVRDMARMLELPVPKGAALRFELVDGLPPVSADAAQLRQVILNLVLNAAEALDPNVPGSVTIRTGVQDCAADSPSLDHGGEPMPPGRYVFVEVADTGLGMDAETLARVFEPFFSTKFIGRGLGLPAALGVVRGHKGFIQARSAVRQGSTFRLMLPTSFAGPDVRPSASGAPPRDQRPLVLVVDDEDAVRTLTLRLIERCGCRAVGAADGVEALAILGKRHAEFACVLLDLSMPRLGGEDTLRELRGFAPTLPVFISSGYEGSDVSKRITSLGVSGFIQKPYQLADLKARITSVVSPAKA